MFSKSYVREVSKGTESALHSTLERNLPVHIEFTETFLTNA